MWQHMYDAPAPTLHLISSWIPRKLGMTNGERVPLRRDLTILAREFAPFIAQGRESALPGLLSTGAGSPALAGWGSPIIQEIATLRSH